MSSEAPVSEDYLLNARLPPNINRQRFKPQLSCTSCRSRKLKCDRDLPCENCVKRELASSCTYVHADMRAKKASHVQKATSSANRELQERVRQLELLVVAAMNRDGSEETSKSRFQEEQSLTQKIPDIFGPLAHRQWTDYSILKETAESFGKVSIDTQGGSVHHDTAWAAVLENIAGLKDSLENGDLSSGFENPEPRSLDGPELLIGARRMLSKDEVLAQLPSRQVADELIAVYFDLSDTESVMIHGPTFKKEYAQFWRNPSATPIMWIGLLCAILQLAVHFDTLSEVQRLSSLAGELIRDPQERMNLFQRLTVQCLILGNYTQPSRYTVETLLLYVLGEYYTSQRNLHGIWLVFGIIVRSALRLEYHKDPSHNPNISIYRGEMQRRVWLAISQLDIYTSSQIGLPRMIKEGMSDTHLPRILLDSDFDETTKVLPPSRRNDSVATSSLVYLSIKTSITSIYGMIIDAANSTISMGYDEVMRIDGLLNDARSAFPEIVQAHSVEDLKVGTPELRTRKFALELCYQKSRCVLHRKYVIPEQTIQRFSYSTKCCIDSAMQILRFQVYAHSEQISGMPPYKQRWKTVNVISHGFILAGMIICLYVGHGLSKQGQNQFCSPLKWSEEDMLDVIDSSCKVWEDSANVSKEAAQTARTFKSMLGKLHSMSSPSPFQVPRTPQASTQANYVEVTQPYYPAQTSSISCLNTPNGDPTFMSDLNGFQLEDILGYDGNLMHASDIDWNLWDDTLPMDTSAQPISTLDEAFPGTAMP